jgi:hypothetical protein
MLIDKQKFKTSQPNINGVDVINSVQVFQN